MMPDLGKYTVWVLSAYGATCGLLIAIVWLSLWRGRKVRDALRAVEARRRQPAARPAVPGDTAHG